MLDYVHSNALELIKEASLGGSRYFVNLIDYFNSKVWIYLFKNKFEVFTNIKLLKVKIENQVDKKIKYLQSDSRTKYTYSNINKFCT